MHKIRWLALVAAAALLVNAGTVATAAPQNFTPAKKLCSLHGGRFIDEQTSPTINSYGCDRLNPSVLTDPDLRAAKALCEGAYKGTFLTFSSTSYDCTDIPLS